jgi:RNA polymerase sigma-70 factor (ECF subfamily)
MMTMAARFPRFTSSADVAAEAIWDGSRLVREAASGDRAAFGELYKRYARMVHGILLARVPFADAEDLTHDVFLSAFDKLAALRQPDAFTGWLASIARNRAVEFHRSARRDGDMPVAEPAARDDHDATFVMEAIRALPEAYRETLVLRLVEGMTGPEIAAQTGLTADSVRVNLSRGMKMLRERLGGKEPK